MKEIYEIGMKCCGENCPDFDSINQNKANSGNVNGDKNKTKAKSNL